MLFKLFHMFVFISSCNISFLKLDCSVPELQQLPVGQVRKHSDSGLEVKLKLIRFFLAVTHLNTKTAMGKKKLLVFMGGLSVLVLPSAEKCFLL